ncbi:helix-turn-helix domain-containing protein [Mycobacterium sp. NPDC006124]|uniref:ArsR/SmtB family transcription factor n=1 Tax=Mycobacterium sp. NPDC006124 TaxID=3156729 RepID=UPI0033BF6146
MNIKPAVTQNTTPTPDPTGPVAGVQQLLVALADPVRLEMVRRLRNTGVPMKCAQLYDGINKSTATHHFKTLREAGITERLVIDGQTHQRLRVDEVDAAVPGLLDSIVESANRESTARVGG